MSACNPIENGNDADSRIEVAVQKLKFLCFAMRSEDAANEVLGNDVSSGIAEVISETAQELESVREWIGRIWKFLPREDVQLGPGAGSKLNG